MGEINLPCLRGRIGDWTYYSTVMKIKDVVKNHRVITVTESEELYSRNINRILQREIDKKRIAQISKYLLENEEHFFSSLIVGIHGGSPSWSDVSVNELLSIKNKKIEKKDLNFIENKFGILTLSGNEEIFALDGQHRLKGLRKSYEKNPDIGDEEVSLVFVIHDTNNIERTRRLFTVLNRYAQKPKEAELIILEEDDVAAINTRRLVTQYKLLSSKNALSNTKSSNMPSNDYNSFTTLITIYRINKLLYKIQPLKSYTTRPSQETIDQYYEISKVFWNFFFKSFPEAERFIKGEREIKIDKSIFDRNSETGGSLLLRPVGQQALAKTYHYFMSLNDIGHLKKNVRKLDFNLSGDVFEYIYWHKGRMLPKEAKLKENIILFLLGIKLKDYDIHEEIGRVYENFNLTYDNSIKPIAKYKYKK